MKRYRKHVKENPADAIYHDATAEFIGASRYDRLIKNLLRKLNDKLARTLHTHRNNAGLILLGEKTLCAIKITNLFSCSSSRHFR